MADVANKAINANNVKLGTVVVGNGTKSYATRDRVVGSNVSITTVTQLEQIYNARFTHGDFKST